MCCELVAKYMPCLDRDEVRLVMEWGSNVTDKSGPSVCVMNEHKDAASFAFCILHFLYFPPFVSFGICFFVRF